MTRRAVPVVDLSLRFGHTETVIGRRTSIIIVTISEAVGAEELVSQQIGVLVDAVNKVVTFTPDDIEPAPAFGAGIRADYISGMAKRDNDFIVVLDIGRVLSLRDIAALDNAMAEALVMGRLDKRLRELGLASYGEYLRLLHTAADELRVAIDALTTNDRHRAAAVRRDCGAPPARPARRRTPRRWCSPTRCRAGSGRSSPPTSRRRI